MIDVFFMGNGQTILPEEFQLPQLEADPLDIWQEDTFGTFFTSTARGKENKIMPNTIQPDCRYKLFLDVLYVGVISSYEYDNK